MSTKSEFFPEITLSDDEEFNESENIKKIDVEHSAENILTEREIVNEILTEIVNEIFTEREIVNEINFFEMSKSEFNVEKLSGSVNYHDWCFAIGNLLGYKGLKKWIIANTPEAGQPESAEEVDAGKLEQAKSILALGVEKNLFVHIRDCDSALKIWRKLQNLFEDRGFRLN